MCFSCLIILLYVRTKRWSLSRRFNRITDLIWISRQISKLQQTSHFYLWFSRIFARTGLFFCTTCLPASGHSKTRHVPSGGRRQIRARANTRLNYLQDKRIIGPVSIKNWWDTVEKKQVKLKQQSGAKILDYNFQEYTSLKWCSWPIFIFSNVKLQYGYYGLGG